MFENIFLSISTITLISALAMILSLGILFISTSEITSWFNNLGELKKSIAPILSSILIGLISYGIAQKISIQKPPPLIVKERNVEEFKDSLRQFKGLYYSTQLPGNQIVQNNTGSYYLIDLVNTKNNEILLFKRGKYIKNALNRDFGMSINAFLTDFDYLKKKNLNPKIYIKGSADKLGDDTFRGYFEPHNVYRKIYFHPIRTSSMFEARIDSVLVREPFRNAELPILRSEFLKAILKNPYGYESEILEGEVTIDIDANDRNVNLILYVEWNS